MSEDEELEALRKRRMMEFQQRFSQEQQQKQTEQGLELQKQALMRRILSPEARQRLTNLKMIKRQFVDQIELQLIQLAQAGRLSIPVTDEKLKDILSRLQTQRRNIKIRRK